MRELLLLLTIVLCTLPAALFGQSPTVHLLSSDQLAVNASADFPILTNYTLLEGNTTLLGNVSGKRTLAINGQEFTPTVTSETTPNSILYSLEVRELEVVLKVKVEVLGNVVDFRVEEIHENGLARVRSVAFPNHELLTVSAREKGGGFAGAKMFTATTGSEGDDFLELTKNTPTDTMVQGYLYGIVSNSKVAAAIWTNAVEEKTDKRRILKNTFAQGGTTYTSIWSGSWIYRAERMTTTSSLPHLKLVITSDVNADKKVDWQDGAIAYRKIMNNPPGAERVKEWVVFRIPMNFASQATNPFSMSLDETKRVYSHTDGLGQFVILKGYGGEGHDSNHPDYGYIGQRQGGIDGINLISNAAPKYNADIGVHINGTESYPEASVFGEPLINRAKAGWNWLDPSYRIDKRYDAAANRRFNRLKLLKDRVPNLDFIYLDVWYARGSWDSRKVAEEINSLDFILATEFPMDLEYNAVWNHWAVDYKYGGSKIKGFNSKIARFIRNHQKDTWIAKHPLLGGAEMVDFEGWQGRINYDDCIDITFSDNLPTKYLQHFPILRWEDDAIQFTNGVEVRMATDGKTILKAGKEVLKNGAYLLPWSPHNEEKLYHWNKEGGTSSWELPDSWKDFSTVYIYELTDQGRINEKPLAISGGKISIDAAAATPFVLYQTPQTNPEMEWGEGTLVANGGFNSGDIGGWASTGEAPAVIRNDNGQYELTFEKGGEAAVSQTVTNLPTGGYCAEVYVQTADDRRASLTVTAGEQCYVSYAENSLYENFIAADSKHGSNLQRMYVFFDVEDYNTTISLNLEVGSGDSTVIFDNARLYPLASRPQVDSIYFQENFEHTPSGLYPFVKGEAGGSNDPRVHLAEKHAPFTQRGWNGKLIDDVLTGNWSLKLHEDAQGLVVQTIPQNLRFLPQKKYRVSFNYQSESDNYAFVLGDGKEQLLESRINPQHKTHKFEFVLTAAPSGKSWFGIKKLDGTTTDLIIDDLMVVVED